MDKSKVVLDIKLKDYPILLGRKIPTAAREFMNSEFRTICWWDGEDGKSLRTVPLENVEFFDLREVK